MEAIFLSETKRKLFETLQRGQMVDGVSVYQVLPSALIA
jgi:hypothetical protein